MKKITFILMAGLTLFFASCQKNEELPAGGPATYSIAATCDTYFDKLPKNGSQVVTIAAVTEDIGIREQLTATFKLGGSDLVKAYNDTAAATRKALEFPSGACAFVKNGVTIDRYNKSSRSASISVSNTPVMEKDALYVLPVLLESVTGADNASTNTDKVVYFLFKALGLDKGQGTKDKPYLIYETEDFVNMVKQTKALASTEYASLEAAAAATPTYFKMMEDIDMSEVTDWEPVNYSGPYNKKVDFNGNGKTLSNFKCIDDYNYHSIFGVLWGDVYDLTVENAYVEGNSAIGIISGYVGTGNSIRGSIKNVKVKNSKVIGTGTNAKGAAIIAGRLQGGEIGCCAAIDCTVEVPCNFPGGILGYTSADGSYIHDCLFKGSVKAYDNSGDNGQRAGGIVGMIAKSNERLENCIALGTVEAKRCVGGIVAHVNNDKWDERHPNATIKGCLAWNKIIANEITSDGSSNAAIIGFTSRFNTVSNNWRKSDFEYSIPNSGFTIDETWNPEGKYNTIWDQNDFSEASPLNEDDCRVKQDATPKYARAPFNGKSTTKTASEMAKTIGWDETIWDLSGDIPSLK